MSKQKTNSKTKSGMLLILITLFIALVGYVLFSGVSVGVYDIGNVSNKSLAGQGEPIQCVFRNGSRRHDRDTRKGQCLELAILRLPAQQEVPNTSGFSQKSNYHSGELCSRKVRQVSMFGLHTILSTDLR